MDRFSGTEVVSTRQHHTYELIDPLKADLKGKYVFVTGASRGIGRAIVISYAKAGASGIALFARSDLSSPESEIYAAAKNAGREHRPHVLSLTVDVTDASDMSMAVEKVTAAFGQVDILINNAGYLETFAPIAVVYAASVRYIDLTLKRSWNHRTRFTWSFEPRRGPHAYRND